MFLMGKSTADDKRRENLGTYALALLLVLSVAYFLIHPGYYIHTTAKGTRAFRREQIALELLILSGSILLLVNRGWIREQTKKYARFFDWAAAVLTPFATLLLSQSLVIASPRSFKLSNYGNVKLRPESLFYNLLILAALLALLAAVTNRLRISCMLCVCMGVLFSLANYYVCKFRSNPILASDFASLGTAMNVAGAYSYSLKCEAVLTLQACFMSLLALRLLRPGKLFSGRKRLAFCGVSFAGVLLAAKVFFLSDYLGSRGIQINRFNALVTYHWHGPFVTLARSFRYLDIQKPEGYQAQQLQSLPERYPSDAAAEGEYPNLIVIVNESFSDLSVLGELNPSEDYIPFFHSLWEESVHGYTYSSVMGGGTANTEFEVLTGNSVLLIPDNAAAFQLYVRDPMESLASYCADLGYQGIAAVHPYQRNNYRRQQAYPLLGFSEYFSMEDFPEDALKICGLISDAADYALLLQKYEEAKAASDAPVFLYTMTMQNHGGYNRKQTNLPMRISLPDHNDAEAEQYVNRVRCTDDALKELIAYFEKQDEPTAVLFLGDHQPDLTSGFLNSITNGGFPQWTGEELMRRYAIPFVLWANYELPAKEYEKTSMNYLQSILADTLGLPMTGYQKYLLEMMEEIPAVTANGYWGKNGSFYQTGDGTSPYYDTLTEYKQILYSNILDTKNRPEAFFCLSGAENKQ